MSQRASTPQHTPWFVFAGGGTGGHLYPGIAVATALKALVPKCDISFFTTTRPIDIDIIGPTGHHVIPQPVQPFNARPWKWPGFAAAYLKSIKLCKGYFKNRAPSAVLGFGGYASVPPVVAARKFGAPTAVFNPDALPGRANKSLMRRAAAIFVQWDETRDHLGRPPQLSVTGCPVRPEFFKLTREEGCHACGLDPAKHVLLIFGASQGATSINATAIALADYLAEFTDWQIIHITGPADLDAVRKAYAGTLPHAKVMDFTPRMAWVMAAADIVLCRAGASTLAELSAAGKPSILMPYPYDRRKHQRANAQVLANSGGAVIVDDAIDAVRNAKELKPLLRDMMTSQERRRRMARAVKAICRPDAAEMIARGLIDLAGDKA